jgi:hemoglobin-like flavoprotein
MTVAPVDAFRASLKRCLETPYFMKEFYDRFIESSAEVREKFRNTDFVRQTRVVADSLYLMAVAAEAGPQSLAWRELRRIARRHDELGVGGTMYDVWLECLVQAARSHDPQFSPELESAWRATLIPGIEHMRDQQRPSED